MQKRNRQNPMNFAVQVRMREEMFNKVEKAAGKLDISAAEFIRRLIRANTK